MKEWVVAKRKERLVEFAAQKENPQRTEKQSSQKVSNLIVTMCTSDVFFLFLFFSPQKTRILPCKQWICKCLFHSTGEE